MPTLSIHIRMRATSEGSDAVTGSNWHGKRRWLRNSICRSIHQTIEAKAGPWMKGRIAARASNKGHCANHESLT
jgi:hypothetical protein